MSWTWYLRSFELAAVSYVRLGQDTKASRAYEEATHLRKRELLERNALGKVHTTAARVELFVRSSSGGKDSGMVDKGRISVTNSGKGAVEAGEGQRFSVCRSTVFPPSDFRPTPGIQEPPANELELQWVYGYRGSDCYAFGRGTVGSERLISQPGRNNLSWAANVDGVIDGSTIVYFTSSVGVVMDIRQRKQVSSPSLDPRFLCTFCIGTH